jgi:hypothetical protein
VPVDIIDVKRVAPISLSFAQVQYLMDNVGHLESRLIDGYLDNATELKMSSAVTDALGDARVNILLASLSNVRSDLPGYLIFRLGPDFVAVEENILQNVLTSLCSIFGHPVRVFDRWPIWKPLGVSFEVAPHRATGTGYNPLHIDVVNSVSPPDYVAFFCDRPDPAGGGQTILSNLLKALTLCSTDTQQILSEAVYREGSFYGLTGVGGEYNPFPIVDRSTSVPRIRFTAKMLGDVSDPLQRAALNEFYEALVSIQDIIELRAGDMIIYNQWVSAHGRLPLGHGQEKYPLERRRLIRQCFINSEKRK